MQSGVIHDTRLHPQPDWEMYALYSDLPLELIWPLIVFQMP
jgi:hypothetical protein